MEAGRNKIPGVDVYDMWRDQLQHISFIKVNILNIHTSSFQFSLFGISTAVDQWFLDYLSTLLIVLTVIKSMIP